MEYNATATVNDAVTDEAVTDRLLDALVGYSPAIGWDSAGRLTVTITVDLPAPRPPRRALSGRAIDTLLDAFDDALRGMPVGPVVAVEVMTTEEFDRRVQAPAVSA